MKIAQMVTELWRTQQCLWTEEREVTPKLRKGEQPFLYATYYLVIMHIAIKFHHDIPNSY